MSSPTTRFYRLEYFSFGHWIPGAETYSTSEDVLEELRTIREPGEVWSYVRAVQVLESVTILNTQEIK